jgi:tetratricopeptide (TPR) repeat protein
MSQRKLELDEELKIAYLIEITNHNKRLAEEYRIRGITHSRYRQHKLALDDFEQAYRLTPLQEISENDYWRMGFCLFSLGHLQKALSYFNLAIKKLPNFARAHLGRGVILESQGKPEEALMAYNTAIEKDPNYANAHNNRGTILKRQGKLEEALMAYNTAIEKDPRIANYHYNRGVILERQDKPAEALMAYNTAIEKDPNYAYAHNNRGVILEKQGKLEEALTTYNTAIQKHPNYAHAHTNRAAILTRLGKLDEAYGACQKVFLLTQDEELISACEKLTKEILNPHSKDLPASQGASSFADDEADILIVGRTQYDGHVSNLDLISEAIVPEVDDFTPIKRERNEPPVEETQHVPASQRPFFGPTTAPKLETIKRVKVEKPHAANQPNSPM